MLEKEKQALSSLNSVTGIGRRTYLGRADRQILVAGGEHRRSHQYQEQPLKCLNQAPSI
jgi:hypothetical protein